jgi:uncharacterized repeat protein (TIGR02543 family)
VKGRWLFTATVLAAAAAIGCSSPAGDTTTTSATPTTYKVSYDGNGATSGSAPVDSNSYQDGASVTVLDNTGGLAKTNYAFSGWNTAADGSGTSYAAGDKITVGSANIMLYAKWTSNVGAGGLTVSAPAAVTVALSLSSSLVASGNPITATVSTSAAVDSYAWYLDGSVVVGQTTASFSGGTSLAAGPHTLMVVVRKDGIAYSASVGVKVQ